MTEPKNDTPEGAEPTETDEELDAADATEAADAAAAELEPEPWTELADDVDEATESEAMADEGDVVVGPPAGARRRGAPAAAAAPVPERAIRVEDRISKIFVLGTVGVFLVILLNGVFFGVGGVLTPFVSPTPAPTASPSAVVSASPSASASVSPSASGSTAPSVSVAPSASGSAAPSGSGAAAPSVSPSPS
jgi:cytoskeletal protein RodZ